MRRRVACGQTHQCGLRNTRRARARDDKLNTVAMMRDKHNDRAKVRNGKEQIPQPFIRWLVVCWLCGNAILHADVHIRRGAVPSMRRP